MKKLSLFTIIILTLAMSLCACSDKSDSNNNKDNKDSVETEKPNKKEYSSLADLYTDLEYSVEFTPMFEVTDEYALNLFGIDTTTLDDSVLYISEDVMSPDTVIIIKSSDADKRAKIESLLKDYVDSKLIELEDYNPENYDIVKKCEVKTSKDYVYLIITKNITDANEFMANSI